MHCTLIYTIALTNVTVTDINRSKIPCMLGLFWIIGPAIISITDILLLKIGAIIIHLAKRCCTNIPTTNKTTTFLSLPQDSTVI